MLSHFFPIVRSLKLFIVMATQTYEAPVNICIAAKVLKVTPERLKELADAGKVPCIRSGGEFRFYRSDLYHNWLEINKK